MKEIYIPLFSGLVGALIGAMASIITIWVQARIQDRREKIRHAADLALEDYKLQIDMANKSGRQASIPPVVLFLHYHLELMNLMEKGRLTPERLKKLSEKNAEIEDAIDEVNKQRKESKLE